MNISFLKPTDQPAGKTRLLWELKNSLTDSRYSSFYISVAFAKVSPLLKMYDEITAWINTKTIHAIIGIDQLGTSSEALQFSLDHFTETSILHIQGGFSPTFHPKIYLFVGDSNAVAYIGSNNLTVGGTETNFESYIKISMVIPEDIDFLNEVIEGWETCKKSSRKLDKDLLNRLIVQNLVQDEKTIRSTSKRYQQPSVSSSESVLQDPVIFTKFKTVPPDPLPRNVLISKTKEPTQGKRRTKYTIKQNITPATTLIMDIVPHHNGEVFLSKNAVNQNHAFFGWPFTGHTKPKKETNPSYPQRFPDPIVELVLIDQFEDVVYRQPRFNLNTVYYEPKSEIRITVPQDIIQRTKPFIDGPYPILVMTNDEINEELDYRIEIYLPGSQQYKAYNKSCNQTMPSGGKSLARKFGWL